MYPAHLLEPCDELLARALGVAAVRVLGGLASVDEGHVTVLLVLLVQLVEDLTPIEGVGERRSQRAGTDPIPDTRAAQLTKHVLVEER